MKIIDINTNRANHIARAMKRDRMPFRNAVVGVYFYYYIGRMFEILVTDTNDATRIIPDEMIAAEFDKYPDAPATIVNQDDQPNIVPDDVKGRKGVKTITVADETELAAIIMDESGVTIKPTILSVSHGSGLHGDPDNKKTATVNVKKATAIIDKIHGKDAAPVGKIRFMMADGRVSAGQRSFGLKIKALVNKLRGW